MAFDTAERRIRIPNLPLGQIVEQDGTPTDDELTFRQGLVTALQQLMGNEGLVVPIQNPTDANTILNHKNEQDVYTTLPGTLLYVQHPTDYTQDRLKVVFRNGNDYPISAPVFKTITVT